jgi:hypothetical protein
MVPYLCSETIDPLFKIMCQNLGLPEDKICELEQLTNALDGITSGMETTGCFDGDDLDDLKPIQEKLAAITAILSSLKISLEANGDWRQGYASKLLRAVSDLSPEFLRTGGNVVTDSPKQPGVLQRRDGVSPAWCQV